MFDCLDFRPRAKFDLDQDIPNLDGQVYIVTGGTSGLGFAITAHLLHHNASKIVILSSNQDKAKEAIQKLQQWGDTSRLEWQYCDLRDLKQVDKLARKLKSQELRIDGLVLNAGIGVGKYSVTKDHIDSHFQVNMLSQLHLALTLLPSMHKTSAVISAPTRIVFMTSAMHENVPKTIKFSNTDEINTDIGQQALYYRSKLAQIVIVLELVRRGFDTGTKSRVLINATHPGDFNRTPLIEELRIAFGIWGTLLLFFLSPFMPDPITTGCRSALFAATPNKELFMGNALSGQYIVPDKQPREPSKMAQDRELGHRLWRLSMNILEDKIGKLPYSTYE